MRMIELPTEANKVPSISVCRKGYSLEDAPPIVTIRVDHIVRERPAEPLRERSPQEIARLRSHPLFAEEE